MRHTTVEINGRIVLNQQTPGDPLIKLAVDGLPVSVGEIPKVVCDEEPKEIGSQVRARSKRLSTGPHLFTKIGPGQWVCVYSRESNGRAYADQVAWKELSVVEVVRPAPPKVNLEEPKGFGACVSGDCWWYCKEQDVFFVLDLGKWICQNCGREYSWATLTEDGKRDELIIVHSKGVNEAKGVEK